LPMNLWHRLPLQLWTSIEMEIFFCHKGRIYSDKTILSSSGVIPTLPGQWSCAVKNIKGAISRDLSTLVFNHQTSPLTPANSFSNGS
jgi:hypothetical protein